MGLFQKALETYNHMEHYAGKEIEGRETLAPIGHMIAKSQIEITLDADGNFSDAQKTERKIIIPVTEASSGRGNAPAAHGLCDQLGYVSNLIPETHNCYMTDLEAWVVSPFTHKKIQAVYTYLKKETIIRDLQTAQLLPVDSVELQKNEKVQISWVVIGLNENSGPVWTDDSLIDAYTSYYSEKKQKEKQELCMLTGNVMPVANQHIRGVVALNGSAKIVSANDNANYTFRGRFTSAEQALTIGYESSQKAHNALKWLVANYGEIIGGRTFVCWNPKGLNVPRLSAPFMKTTKKNPTMTDYKQELNKTLVGYQTELPLGEDVVIVSFDAATKGRLSVAYYNELQGSDFLERLKYWDETCCWISPFYNKETEKTTGLHCFPHRYSASSTLLSVPSVVLKAKKNLNVMINC